VLYGDIGEMSELGEILQILEQSVSSKAMETTTANNTTTSTLVALMNSTTILLPPPPSPSSTISLSSSSANVTTSSPVKPLNNTTANTNTNTNTARAGNVQSRRVQNYHHQEDEKNVKEEEEEEESDSEEEEGEEDAGGNLINQSIPLLSQHIYGDSLARLHATGAYLYTLYTQYTTVYPTNTPNTTTNASTISRKRLLTVCTNDIITSFCQNQGLHSIAMQHIVDLRIQLQSLGSTLFPELFLTEHTFTTSSNTTNTTANTTSMTMTLPSLAQYHTNPIYLQPCQPNEDIYLRQLLLSGYGDCIVRKAAIGTVKSGTTRQRFTGYLSCHPALINEVLYIHPQSSLYPKNPIQSASLLPEYLIYTHLQRNTKGTMLYMMNVTVIQENWMSSILIDCPLLTLSKPLASPMPKYNLQKDSMECYIQPKYGYHGWLLPLITMEFHQVMHYHANRHDSPITTTASSSSSSASSIGHRIEDEIYR